MIFFFLFYLVTNIERKKSINDSFLFFESKLMYNAIAFLFYEKNKFIFQSKKQIYISR